MSSSLSPGRWVSVQGKKIAALRPCLTQELRPVQCRLLPNPRGLPSGARDLFETTAFVPTMTDSEGLREPENYLALEMGETAAKREKSQAKRNTGGAF